MKGSRVQGFQTLALRIQGPSGHRSPFEMLQVGSKLEHPHNCEPLAAVAGSTAKKHVQED